MKQEILKQNKNIPDKSIRHTDILGIHTGHHSFYFGHCQMYGTYFRTCYFGISISLF